MLHDVHIYMENGENRNIKAKMRQGKENKTRSHADAEKLSIQFKLLIDIS